MTMDDDTDSQDDWIYEVRFQDSVWTLEQTLAWIVTKDAITTGSLSPESLAEISYEDAWQNLKDRDLLVARCLKYVAFMSDHSIRSELSTAHREIIQALRAGQLVATWKLGRQMRTDITRFHWMDYSIERNARGFLDVEGGDMIDGNQLRVERDEVLKIWPQELPARASARKDEKNATELLTKRMKESPNNPTMTKNEALDWLKSQFPSLGVRAGDRAWASAIELAKATAWGEGGRRPSANRNRTPI